MVREQEYTQAGSREFILQRAADSYARAAELAPGNTDAIVGRANVAVANNDIDQALDFLLRYVEVSPSRYRIHAIIGRLLFHEARYDEAATYLTTAYDNRPNLPFVAGDLGYLNLIAGKNSQAVKLLREAHQLQPSDQNILKLLAEAEFETGNYLVARELFERVTQRNPTRRRAKNVLAWIMSTCPYQEQRDGTAALNLIRPLEKVFGQTSPATLEIYAACLAEIGKVPGRRRTPGKGDQTPGIRKVS